MIFKMIITIRLSARRDLSFESCQHGVSLQLALLFEEDYLATGQTDKRSHGGFWARDS